MSCAVGVWVMWDVGSGPFQNSGLSVNIEHMLMSSELPSLGSYVVADDADGSTAVVRGS